MPLIPGIVGTAITAIWVALKTARFSSILIGAVVGIGTTLLITNARQEKIDYNKAIKSITSPFGVIMILGVIWGGYLIVKEVKRK